MRHKDWDGRRFQEFTRHAAEEKFARPRMTVRAKHHNVCLIGSRLID
jgi:uncharacterized protein with HEPN domain